MTLDRESTIETFRQMVLEALDRAAHETFKPSRNDAGATDADLPRLFKAIDAQVEALADRYDVVLITPLKRKFEFDECQDRVAAREAIEDFNYVGSRHHY